MGTSIKHLWAADQWAYIRKNIGQWYGSFIRFSPEATRMSETPSVLTLQEDCPGQHMTLVLKRTPPGKDTHVMERELGYPGAVPYICFFPTGAFSQGTMQRRPLSSFGAEFSLLANNRRMRLIQLYKGTADGQHTLDYVTLVPEHRSPEMAKTEQTRLSLDDLLGTWRGECIYLPATMETPQVNVSYWQAQQSNDELLLTWGTEGEERRFKMQRFTLVDQHRWQAIDQSLQLWLLPGGVSCMIYPNLPQHQNVRLELCWYLSPQQRQRIVRDYDDTGDWVGTSLMLETRV